MAFENQSRKYVPNHRKHLKYQLWCAEAAYAEARELRKVKPELGEIEKNLHKQYKKFYYMDVLNIMILDNPAGDIEHKMNAVQIKKNDSFRAD